MMRKVVESFSRELNEFTQTSKTLTVVYKVVITYRLECGHITTRVGHAGTTPSKRLQCKECKGSERGDA